MTKMSCVLHIAGMGGHGSVVKDAASSMGKWASFCFYDDIRVSQIGAPIRGTIADLEKTVQDKTILGVFEQTFVAIGANGIRKAVSERLLDYGAVIATIRHSKSVESDNVDVGCGVLLMPLCVLNAGAKLGDGVIVNTGAIVEHDCSIGRYTHVCPGAVVAGGVSVGESALIGAGAVIREGISIGSNTVVGAGSVVVKNVRCGDTVYGNPARKM